MRCSKCNKVIGDSRNSVIAHYRTKHPELLAGMALSQTPHESSMRSEAHEYIRNKAELLVTARKLQKGPGYLYADGTSGYKPHRQSLADREAVIRELEGKAP